jgi:hypothetical protein
MNTIIEKYNNTLQVELLSKKRQQAQYVHEVVERMISILRIKENEIVKAVD